MYNHRLAVTNFCPHQTLDSEASSHYNPEVQGMDVGTSLLSIPSVLFKRFSNFAYAARKQKPSENQSGDFPGGLVVNNLPCNTGDVGSIPGWGTKIPHASEQPGPHATAMRSRALEPVCHN